MALEKWEIDLRKQLEGVPPSKNRKEPWEENLEREIKDVPPKKSSGLSYAIIILFLLGSVLFVYDMKTGGITNWFKKSNQSPTVVEPGVVAPPVPNKTEDPQIKALRAELDRMKAENKQQFDSLDRRVKWNGDRITLLATVQQENFLTIRNGGNNFIYFNADWTIDRMPQYLELTPEDKDFLNKYLKKE